LIVDFGGQYCHLIGRRIRQLGVYSEIIPYDLAGEQTVSSKRKLKVKGTILSGGPSRVYDDGAPKSSVDVLALGMPIMGLCYGHQLIAFLSGGRVGVGQKKEYGTTRATITKPIGVLRGMRKHEKVWMSHGDVVLEIPQEYEVLAYTENCPVAAFKHRDKPIYGLQWHPEVIHTERGMETLRNFVFYVCKCKANYRPTDFLTNASRRIRQIVGCKKAIIALSGGIDSSTAAVLAAKAIGANLTAVFVDHGLMRAGEPESIPTTLQELKVKLIVMDAKKRFLKRLRGISDPEQKRRIVGKEFIKVFEGVAEDIGAEYLIQGTIYPDRIESGARKHSEKIKTHHNVGGLPTKVKFKAILEPLSDLYKDEVRKVADRLGIPKEVIQRQPFPGPGLSVRVMGSVTQEKIDVVRKADEIVTGEIEKSGLRGKLWQYFAVLTDTKSTGIKGDSRAYGYTVAIRAVESLEAMTAKYTNMPYRILERISTRITNEIPQVTRVVYDVTNKPPATIEWE